MKSVFEEKARPQREGQVMLFASSPYFEMHLEGWQSSPVVPLELWLQRFSGPVSQAVVSGVKYDCSLFQYLSRNLSRPQRCFAWNRNVKHDKREFMY